MEQLDIITMMLSSGSYIQFNNGSGFTTVNTSAMLGAGEWVTAGDFNNDGKQDLAISDNVSNSLRVYNGNGDGTFAVSQSINIAAYTGAIIGPAADLNGDGALDLTFTNYGGASNSVQVLLGTGSGTFGASYTVGQLNNPINTVVADFNSDGILDIAGLASTSANLGILIGPGGRIVQPCHVSRCLWWGPQTPTNQRF